MLPILYEWHWDLGLLWRLCLIFLLAWKLFLTDDEKSHVLALNPFRRTQKQPL